MVDGCGTPPLGNVVSPILVAGATGVTDSPQLLWTGDRRWVSFSYCEWLARVAVVAGASDTCAACCALTACWTLSILIVAAVVGLVITPRPFNSATAIHRGLEDGLTVTRNSPVAFRLNQRPEERTLIDWIRTLDVYPEPDAYRGLPARVEGFAVHSPQLPETYLTLTRFVITCCAADAYPVGLPVKLGRSRQAYPQDQWFRVEGRMTTETLNDRRQLVLVAETITPIPEPENPFMY